MNTIATIFPKIDVNSQLLYDYDIPNAIEYIKSNNIKDIICTPNIEEFRENNFTSINQRFKILKNSFENTDTNIFLGVELNLNYQTLSFLKRNRYYGKYLVVSFDYDIKEDRMMDLLNEVMDLGYGVILAHPEEYECFRKTSIIEKLKENDIIIEVDATNIINNKDKKSNKFALKLLKKGLIDVVASSDTNHKDFVDCFDYICEKYNYRLANNLFYENPKVIVDSLKK